ncbi:MAG TPA: methionyl-tRNA formyltransferase [Bryobacteraceae bacterium]|nr:methionyl-tRNA formyltransferase [Bryobacteraceae bacterium]
MELIFLGTPSFAVPTLERIVAAGHRVLAVFTQPDRPKGRGGQLAASPVKETALRLGLPVHQPERVRRPEVVEQLRGMRPQAMVVVGYGQIIPQSIIDIPPRGIINVHASLLPKYRGAAPIQWAVANGERRTGVTTMRIDAGLDTGDMLQKWETEIGAEENAVELGQRLSRAGADLLIETLQRIEAGTIQPQPQDNSQATLAPILKKEDGTIDWTWPAAKVFNRTRGFLPWPGAYSFFRSQLFHIWKSRVAESAPPGQPGRMIPQKKRLFVACGEGSTLEPLEVQIEGRKRMSAEAFLNGQHLHENETLGVTTA